ncbi:Protein of unknown function (DUF1676) [Sarracenia purpurea var. burkii]
MLVRHLASFIIMFHIGTRARCISRSFLVLVTLSGLWPVQSAFFDKSFFASTGNTLWDELYQKCGNSRILSLRAKQTDELYKHHVRFRSAYHRWHLLRQEQSSVSGVGFAKHPDTFNNGTSYHSRSGRAVKKVVTIADNNIENSTEPFTEEPAEQEFANFVRSVEKVEKDIEMTEKYATEETVTTDIPVVVNSTTTTTSRPIPPRTSFVDDDEEEHPENENLVIRSLNKVTDILYDKTTDYLSSHDLKLDLPQTLFGGSKVRISPRGYDADGGIILKLNVYPAETPRTHQIAKYIRKL